MKFLSFTLFMGFLLIGSNAISQKRLMMSRSMMQTWDESAKEWSGWPSEYTSYADGDEPILQFTKLDDEGIEFNVAIWAPDKSDFDVKYTGFREDQDAHVYEDSAGDEIWIIGATMSELSKNGWPEGTTVSIYFWIYSDNYSLLLE
jgi:hypothetical protein